MGAESNKYTNEARIEAVTSVDITDTTTPSTAQTQKWIEEVESEIDRRALGTNYAEGELIDVEGEPKRYETLSSEGVSLRRPFIEGLYVVPSKRPILTVSNLWVNNAGLSDTPDWDIRKEGPADDASFVVLRTKHLGKALGYAFYFFQDIPSPGKSKIKADYTYGWQLPQQLLEEYATLKVAVKVLQAKLGSSSAAGVSTYTGGSLQEFFTVNYKARIDEFRLRIKEIDALIPSETSFALIGVIG